MQSEREMQIAPEVVALAWLRCVLSPGLPVDDVKMRAGAFDGGVRRDWASDVRRVAAMAEGRDIKTPPLLRLMNIDAISANVIEEARIVAEQLAAKITAEAQSVSRIVDKPLVFAPTPNPNKRSRMSVEQVNKKAMELAEEDPEFLMQGIRDWADKIGCSISTFHKTRFWKGTMHTTGRDRSRGPSANVVPLTNRLEETIGDGERHKALNDLVAQQEKDFEPSPLDSAPSRKKHCIHKQL